jgi:hypothetical protein
VDDDLDPTRSEPDSLIGSEPDSADRSNERTDERTYEEGGDGRRSGHHGERARRRTDDDIDIPMLGDVIAAGFMRSWERHEVVREGERDPIPAHIRAAVWYRDRGRCAMCPGIEYQPEGPLHLDHILPWSAGGSDRTENLRLLCGPHNLDRSNFIDYAGPKLPATWWCHRCYTEEQYPWTYYLDGSVDCPTHGLRTGPDGPWCRVGRAYRRTADSGVLAGDWTYEQHWHHRADPIRSFHLIAYCAHCNKPGETSVTL